MGVELVRDFAYAGTLLLVGYILREKVRLFQKLYIPAAVIAGIIGLFLGPEVLGRFCPFSLKFSENIGSLAMPLLAIVFSTQFIGSKFDKKIIRHSMATCILNCAVACMQVFLGLVLILGCIKLHPDVPLGFGLMPYTGFYGGHGVAAAVAGPFEALGYWASEISMSVGNTFATIGMIFGIVVGILIINIAARKGLIEKNAGMANLSTEVMSGYIPVEKRSSAVDKITKNDAINPVAFQMAMIGLIMYIGYILLDQMVKIPGLETCTITIPVIFVGIFMSVLGKKTSLGKYMDRKSLVNTSGAALEFLIATSVATTKLSIFVDYGFELLLLSVVLLGATTFYVLFFGRMWHKENWVVNSLGTFGLASGVLATGFLLIRVADPDSKTTASTNLAIGNSISTLTVQMGVLMFLPAVIVKAPNLAVGIMGAGFLLFTIGGLVIFRKKE